MNAKDLTVVGVDGSESSVAALRWALSRSAAGQRVHLISAFGWSDGIHPHMSRETAETNIDSALSATDRPVGIAITSSVVEGEPVDVLLNAAEAAQLLVVGRHGTRGMIHNAFASVGDTCSRMAACPVVIVPA